MPAIHSNASVARHRLAGKRENMSGGSRQPADGLWYFGALHIPRDADQTQRDDDDDRKAALKAVA
jgi:hypothetical protein